MSHPERARSEREGSRTGAALPERRPATTCDARRLLAISLLTAPCHELPLAPGTAWTYDAKVSWTVVGSAAVRDTTLIWRTSVLSMRTSGGTAVATVLNWPVQSGSDVST